MTDQELNHRFDRVNDILEHLAQAQLDTDREINALATVQHNALESLKALHEITSAHTLQINRLDAAIVKLIEVQAETSRQFQAYLTTIHQRQ